MSFDKKNKNLLLNQFIENEKNDFSVNELIPLFSNQEKDIKFLSYYKDIKWNSIKGGDQIIISKNDIGDIIIDCSIYDPFESSEMYFNNGQIGIGGIPLHSYKVDIRVPENTRTTALHIGDGVFGFSMGNATNNGFLPQIIGIGSDETDAGFYILGKTSLDTGSNIPAIILDGRNLDNSPLNKRPILGISSGSYSDYKLIVDAQGNVGIGSYPEEYKLKVEGILKTKDVVFDTSIGVTTLRKEIEELKARLEVLEK